MSILLDNQNYKFYNNTTEFKDDIILKPEDIIYINDKKNYKFSITQEVKTGFDNYTDEQFKNEIVLLCINKCIKQNLNNSRNSITNLLLLFKKLNQNKNSQIKSPFDFTNYINYTKNNLIPLLKGELINYKDQLDDKKIMLETINNYINKLDEIKYSSKNVIDKQNDLYKFIKPFVESYENVLVNPFNTNINVNNIIYNFLFNNRNILDKNYYNFLKKDYDFVLLDENYELYDNLINSNELKNINDIQSLLNEIKRYKYRFLSNRKQNINRNTELLYDGDKTSLIGFYKKINHEENQNSFKVFNLQKYFEDIEELKEKNKVNIVLNYNNNKILKGKIKKIETGNNTEYELYNTNNLLTIKLEEEIKLYNPDTNSFDKKSKILEYDKNKYNYCYIFPENEETYFKNLKNNKNEIFLFPNNFMFLIQNELNNLDLQNNLDLELNKNTIIHNLVKKFSNYKFILQLYNYIIDYINITPIEIFNLIKNKLTNQNEFENILIENGYNISNIKEDLSNELYNILNKNVKNIKKLIETKKEFSNKEFKDKKLLENNNFVNFEDFSKLDNSILNNNSVFLKYYDYLYKNKFNESSSNQLINRLNYLNKQYDNGYIFLTQYLKNVLFTEYINILDDYEISQNDINKITSEKIEYENEVIKNINKLIKNINKEELDKNNDKVLLKIRKEIKIINSEINKLKLLLENNNKNDCNNISIFKIYYNESQFNNDEKNSILNSKYVILIDDSNFFGNLYLNKNNKWVLIKYLNSKIINDLNICIDDKGNFNNMYLNLEDKKECIYDDYESLCEKRDNIENKYKLKILEDNLSILENKKEFIKNFKIVKKNLVIDDYLNDIIKYYAYSKIKNNYKIVNIIKNKKISLKNYQGNQDFVDFDDIYNNFEGNDYIPIVIEEEQISSTANQNDYVMKEDDQIILGNSSLGKDQLQIYDIFTRNVLKKIGIMFNEQQIKHIVKSIDFYKDILLDKKIEAIRRKDNKYLKMSKKEILNEIYENDIDRNKELNRNLLYIITSYIVIITQIVYPDLKILKINKKLIKYFSFGGYPANKKTDQKQFIFYVSQSVFNEYSKEFDLKKLENVTNNIIKIIKFIITKREYYQVLLNNNVKNLVKLDEYDNDENIINYQNIAWDGFKPELNISEKPTTLIGKHLYDIYSIVNNSDKELYDIFNKPLIFNYCCKDILDDNYNYYNYISRKLDINENLNKIRKKDNDMKLKTKEHYINYIKNVDEKISENILIFGENVKIFSKNTMKEIKTINEEELNKFNIKYYQFNKNLNNIIQHRKRLLNYQYMIKDIKNNLEFTNLTNNITKLNNNLIKLVKDKSTYYEKKIKKIKQNQEKNYLDIEEDIFENIKKYVLNFGDDKKILQKNHLLRIKELLKKYNNRYLIELISKIKYNSFKDKDDKFKTDNEKKMEDLSKLIDENTELKEWKLDENINKFKINVNTLNIHHKDLKYENLNNNINDNENTSNIVDIKKEITLLYLFIIDSIYELYNLLIEKEDIEYNYEIIIENIKQLDNSNYVIIISNIIYIIFDSLNTDLLNINKKTENLQTAMDDYREERKQKQINYYNNLSIETKDVLKLMKDSGIEVSDIVEDDEDPPLVIGDEERITNPGEIEDILADYKGENDDEIIEN